MARSIEQRGHHMICALIGTSRELAAYNYTSSLALRTTLEYELVDVYGVRQSIQKVGVKPATRSVVATYKRNFLREIKRIYGQYGWPVKTSRNKGKCHYPASVHQNVRYRDGVGLV